MEEIRAPKNFIEEFIEEDIKEKGLTHIQTRFPPEPNGYLHIGHAKALAIDFTMAEKFGGSCNLRYDDTNPTKEDEEFVDAIQEDIAWLGFHWDNVFYGSDYFEECYELAVKLIKKGVAYVCDLSKDEMREYRGTLTEPGRNSPWRDRSVEENLDLFQRMKDGEFPDGSRTLRAKIDMASPNLNMRDPAMYRIIHMTHHHQGDKWCIYPMYDFAHPIQDAIEGVTHSLCSLEYEAHRPLYNWVIEQCEFEHKPRQIEFARLNMTNTIMSKRYLRRLVEELPMKYPAEVVVPEYRPGEFYSAVKGLEDMPEGGERCFVCYRLRLEKAAQYAAEHGFDYFCSTLSISPMKNAAKLNEIGEELSEIYPVKLLPSDFKKKGGYLRSIELSREYGLYRQNYCGCVFSKQEAERRESGKINPENSQN